MFSIPTISTMNVLHSLLYSLTLLYLTLCPDFLRLMRSLDRLRWNFVTLPVNQQNLTTKIEMHSQHDDEPPIDRYYIIYFIMFLQGAGCLFPYVCVPLYYRCIQ
jgi:hypothetical protein